ncbi:unnamed protein product [Larinioides sclopetarius]|uniref:Reverse transcriptase domain-containing protein n=1 Tax=Larinioides sclopetarius TaxID=280406 RepID=A0AAV2ATH8_9ARAC
MVNSNYMATSEKAYAAAIYCLTIPDSGEINVQLLIAKTMVSPLGTRSLPRLELYGTLLLAKTDGVHLLLYTTLLYHTLSFIPTQLSYLLSSDLVLADEREYMVSENIGIHAVLLETIKALMEEYRQFGFNKGASINYGLDSLLQKIELNRQKKLHTAVVSIDIKGAFDSLEYDSIIKKFIQIDCPINIHLISESFNVSKNSYLYKRRHCPVDPNERMSTGLL